MRAVSLGGWVGSTSLGWALGLILVIVLVLGSETIGMGSAGVGLLQSRAPRGLLSNAPLQGASFLSLPTIWRTRQA
jgi:hypothetical protein